MAEVSCRPPSGPGLQRRDRSLGVEVKERKTFAFELLGERDSPEERMFSQPGFGLRRWFRIERLRMRPGQSFNSRSERYLAANGKYTGEALGNKGYRVHGKKTSCLPAAGMGEFRNSPASGAPGTT